MRIAPLQNPSAVHAVPPGGKGTAFSAVERRSFPAAATARQDGCLAAVQMTIDWVGAPEPPISLMQGLIRDFSARTTAERLAAFALRKFLADGVPPSRAAIERAFAETQAAVEKGVRLALRLLRSRGAGPEALGGAAEMEREMREFLARWRAGELARLGGEATRARPPQRAPPSPRSP
ncbi:MAG: hypothetical protein A3J27_06875 [Candidatus Tectomicrobia bacterium RIFCSPLOWO2_12_FULL_69_37]|nr:MAG: hypothetical protein A3J27_06875 [Candidatus Tectomicrobia bacterium RIFCSPLOWO2_12_FULL_69_37]